MTSSNGSISALLAICVGISPVPGEFPAQRPVTRSLDVFFDLRLNKRLSKQWWGWWFETLSHPLWRHRVMVYCEYCVIEWLWNLEMTYLCWFDSYDSNPVKYVLMNALNLKQLFFFQNVVLFSDGGENKWSIPIQNYSNALNLITVLRTHPCVSRFFYGLSNA